MTIGENYEGKKGTSVEVKKTTEQQERKLEITRFAAECKKIFENEEEWYSDWSEDMIKSLAIGARPGVLLGTPHFDTLKLRELFSARGISLVVIDRLLINEDLLQKRIQSEPEVLVEVGWDAALAMRENLLKIDPTEEASPEQHALLGFVLGYPISALRSYRESKEICLRKGKYIPDLFSLEANGSWEMKYNEAVVQIGIEKEFLRPLRGVELKEKTRAYVERNEIALLNRQRVVTEIYKNYYGLSDQEIPFFRDRRPIHLFSPNEELYICTFTDLPENSGLMSQSVTDMEEQVNHTCLQYGY